MVDGDVVEFRFNV
ncbi:MAG: hypothetical protein L0H43_12230 [Brevibacterium aurantiacum]|nr:hypothetical protein [Brevibacterium aurantiacum]